jgi:hypothetical protein
LEALVILRSFNVTSYLDTGSAQQALAELGAAKISRYACSTRSTSTSCWSARAAFALLTGRLDSARTLIDEAWESGRSVGRLADAFRRLQVAILARETGDLEQLLLCVREIQASANGSPRRRAPERSSSPSAGCSTPPVPKSRA